MWRWAGVGKRGNGRGAQQGCLLGVLSRDAQRPLVEEHPQAGQPPRELLVRQKLGKWGIPLLNELKEADEATAEAEFAKENIHEWPPWGTETMVYAHKELKEEKTRLVQETHSDLWVIPGENGIEVAGLDGRKSVQARRGVHVWQGSTSLPLGWRV